MNDILSKEYNLREVAKASLLHRRSIWGWVSRGRLRITTKRFKLRATMKEGRLYIKGENLKAFLLSIGDKETWDFVVSRL